ncbi:retinol dehydrogenase 12 [Pyrenophora tritici-repentis]|nr:retinol dehydrogenase 12 [Pyrenophora tritici-repentis]KAI0605798.1 retinol dehydrogenase 12 [Pyrenophora tritici-repentis]KAI0617975.1 retinol dehydrogenase 12 [Pyrenophora tritici-repentis]
MGNQWSILFPPPPKFTDANLSDLSGKVYIVTGSSAGVGKELARLLYSHNGTVYLATRTAEKTEGVKSWIKEQHPDSKGQLHYLHLNLNDLEGIKASAETFLAKEDRLDVLFNNAGVMSQEKGTKTKQGYEIHIGTNCVGPFLFTKLLTSRLVETAKKEGQEKGSVRVVWVSSTAADLYAPKYGIEMDNLDYSKKYNDKPMAKYGISKGGNVLHAIEFQRRYGAEGVISVSLHPGILKTEITRDTPKLRLAILNFFVGWMVHEMVFGAYTELYAGLSPDVVGIQLNEWIVPWGRVTKLRKDYSSEEGLENAKTF